MPHRSSSMPDAGPETPARVAVSDHDISAPRHIRRLVRSVPWAGFLLEMLSIVASVLVALWVSDWSEQRKDHARAQEALAGIRRELGDNQVALRASVDYYRSISAEIEKILKDPTATSPTVFTELPGWRGVRSPILNDAVFSAALSTQTLRPVGFDVVAQLSQTYSVLRQCTWFHERLLTDIYEGRVQGIGTLRGRLADLIALTTSVERAVSRALARLDDTSPPSR